MKTRKFNIQSYLKRGSKFGNVQTQYKGKTYHSKKEAEYAMILDDMVRKKEIVSFLPQFRMRLEVNGEKICDYVADFLVETPTGLQEIHETKGYFTDTGKFKWRLAQALYRDQYKFVLIQ